MVVAVLISALSLNYDTPMHLINTINNLLNIPPPHQHPDLLPTAKRLKPTCIALRPRHFKPL